MIGLINHYGPDHFPNGPLRHPVRRGSSIAEVAARYLIVLEDYIA